MTLSRQLRTNSCQTQNEMSMISRTDCTSQSTAPFSCGSAWYLLVFQCHLHPPSRWRRVSCTAPARSLTSRETVANITNYRSMQLVKLQRLRGSWLAWTTRAWWRASRSPSRRRSAEFQCRCSAGRRTEGRSTPEVITTRSRPKATAPRCTSGRSSCELNRRIVGRFSQPFSVVLILTSFNLSYVHSRSFPIAAVR